MDKYPPKRAHTAVGTSPSITKITQTATATSPEVIRTVPTVSNAVQTVGTTSTATGTSNGPAGTGTTSGVHGNTPETGPGATTKRLTIPPTQLKYPLGLEYLLTLDCLFIIKKPVLCKRNYDYIVKKYTGENIFYARKRYMGSCSPHFMEIYIHDQIEREISEKTHKAISVYIPHYLCLYQGKTVEVFAPPYAQIGTVRKEWGFCSPFTIDSPYNVDDLRIEGLPWYTNMSCNNNVFILKSTLHKRQVGQISIQTEIIGDVSNEGVRVTFPHNLNVYMKAVLLGATFFLEDIFGII